MVCYHLLFILRCIDVTETNAATAHPIDIFSLAVTSGQILSVSGASSLKVHSTADPDFPLVQALDGAHKVGCHHVVTSRNGSRAASVGFGGETRVWSYADGTWTEDIKASGNYFCSVSNKLASQL
jgi:superkiller protein 8